MDSMQITLEFKAPSTRGIVISVPSDAILSVEQGGATLRILQDNVPIALFNDLLGWRRDDLVAVGLP